MEEPNRNKPFWRQGDIYFVKLDEESRNEVRQAAQRYGDFLEVPIATQFDN